MRSRLFPLLAALAFATAAVVPSSSALAQDKPKSVEFWWPERLDLSPLRDHDASSNPYGEDFDYAEAFASLEDAFEPARNEVLPERPFPEFLLPSAEKTSAPHSQKCEQQPFW